MSKKEKLDKTAPHLAGMYFETNDEQTEMVSPPVEQHGAWQRFLPYCAL